MANYIDLLGKPFEYGAVGPEAYDCYSLVREMSNRDGTIIPDYNRPEDRTRIVAMMLGEIRLWEECEPEPGAVVLFRTTPQMHVGYCVGNDQFIHCLEKTGVCVERLSWWQHRVMGYYRYVG
jgi:cell wall-associated NlpC family hydrolase